MNDVPVAADDSYTAYEDYPLTEYGLGVLSNDRDADWDRLSAVLVSGPAHGTVTLNADGGFVYTPAPDYSGPDKFTYRASDGAAQSNVATVSLTVLAMDDRIRVTVPGPQATAEDTPLAFGTATGNAVTVVDPESPRLRVNMSAYGTLTVTNTAGLVFPYPEGAGNNTSWIIFDADSPAAANAALDGLVYTPDPDFTDPVTLIVQVEDLSAGGPEPILAWVEVPITITPVNDAPVAVDDGPYTVEAGELLTVNNGRTWHGLGVLHNDPDVDGDRLSAVLVGGPSHGTLALNADGSFTYTAEATYSGTDTFTYTVSDGSVTVGPATVSLTVRAVNDPPVAVDDAYSTTEEAPFSVIVPGFTSLTMTSDPGDYIGQGKTWSYGSGASISLTNPYPSNPAYTNAVRVRVSTATDWWYLHFWAPNNARFVPGRTYTGAARFPFNTSSQPGMDVYGNGRGSNTLTGWFRVDEIAYGPAGEVLVFAATFEQHCEGMTPALRGTVRYNAGATATGGVLLNDSDPEGSPLTAVLVDGPAHGQVYLNPNGTFTYLPDANFAGVDSFRYRASDGAAASAPATVTITVAGVNDAPVNVVPGTQTLVEDTTLTFSAANGNAIRLTDIDAGDSVVELRLSVNGFLTFPTTAGLTFVTGSNGGNVITVRGTLAALNAALDGLVFRPGAHFNGNYTLQVTTSDLGNTGSGGAKTDTDNVTLTVTPVNDAPQNVVPLVTPVTAEDTPLTFSPVIWVNDPDQNDAGAFSRPVRVTLEFAAGSGKLTVTPSTGVTITGNGTGRVVLEGAIAYVNTALRSLVFTPAADANENFAPVQIRMTTDDQANGGPGALTDTDTFAVRVTPVNDPPQFALSRTEIVIPMGEVVYAYYGFASGAVGPVTAADELASQTLSYGTQVTATTGNLAFVAGPRVEPDGWLIFTPAAGTWGTATVRVWASDGLTASADRTFTLTVTNAAPTTSGLPPVSVAEDAAPTAVALTGSFGDIEDGPSGLTYTVVVNTNPGLFGSVTVSGGVLTLSYAANANGSATLTVRATDAGGLFVETPLAVTVRPVNDAPSFAGGPNLTVASDAGAQRVAGWATTISSGPGDEAGQTLTFVVTADSPLLFAVQPAIDPVTGALTFTPVAGASGTATVTVLLRDNGGTADGGADASAPVTFTITLTPPAGSPGLQVVGTELVITGGAGNDSVTITAVSGGNGSNGAKVTGTLNGQSVNKTFRQTLTRIRVSTGTGNDTVTIADAITLPTVVDAGAGDDSVKGGGGADLVYAGDGKDTVDAAGGEDDVDAGAGNDSVTGGLGRDLLWGGTGDDTLQGGDGNDFLIGGLGADQLYGQNGDDILVAGSAAVRDPSSDSLRKVLNDWDSTLSGVYVDLRARLAVTDDPASADRLQGDAGTDWFWSGDPLDVLDLGPGEQRN